MTNTCKTCGTALIRITKSGLYRFYNRVDLNPEWYCPKCKKRFGKGYAMEVIE